MILETQVGIQNLAVGSKSALRSDKSGAIAITDGHARYQETVISSNVFAFTGTITAIAAGQVQAGAAAAALNFAIWNPVGSGKNLVLWQYGQGIVSSSASSSVIGPVWHGMLNTSGVSVLSTGLAYNIGGFSARPNANVWFSAGGSAFTGGLAPFALYMANFGVSGTIGAAATAFPIAAVDNIDGKIIVPPGMGWLPMWNLTQANVSYALSIIWEEIPL